MAELPEDKKIILTTDYKDNTINMEFSDNLVDNREKGYILSAAFLAFAANEGLDKQQVIEMILIMINLLGMMIQVYLKDYRI